MQTGDIMRATKIKAEEEETSEIDLAKSKRLGRGLLKDRRMSLRAVRESIGKTQLDLAGVAGIDQAEVSRLERRDDAKLSTLHRYVRALGGELELVVVMPKTGHRIRLDL